MFKNKGQRITVTHDTIFLKMLVEVENPCPARKRYFSGKDSNVRSPLNMRDKIFMNYWNTRQVFLLTGSSTKSKLDFFLRIVETRNPNVSINTKKLIATLPEPIDAREAVSYTHLTLPTNREV